MKLSKKEKKLILSAIQYEKEILSDSEYSREDMSTVKAFTYEFYKQPSSFTGEQLNLMVEYLELIIKNDCKNNPEVLNLQHKINAYLQTSNGIVNLS